MERLVGQFRTAATADPASRGPRHNAVTALPVAARARTTTRPQPRSSGALALKSTPDADDWSEF